MTKKKVINKDVHFSAGGQKCFREAIGITIDSIEEKLIMLQEKRDLSIKSVIGRPLGGITRLDCEEIKTWKSIPKDEAARVYKLSEELIIVVKDVRESELMLITFIGNNYAEIKRLIEELELNPLENSEVENSELFERCLRVNERVQNILDTKILTFTSSSPYHNYFLIKPENSSTFKIGAKEKTFFLENRKYDLLLIFNFE